MSKLENSELLPPKLLDILQELHSQYKSLKDGVVANYIPELAKVNPDLFSICIVTTDGQIYEVGDFEQLFTIQSISKVFVYGQALTDHGRDYVLKCVRNYRNGWNYIFLIVYSVNIY